MKYNLLTLASKVILLMFKDIYWVSVCFQANFIKI